MATGDAAKRYLENAMAAQMPALAQQQEGMRKYLQGTGQRIGAKGAAQQARKAVDVYATKSGNVAAKLGAESERMGQQQEQFEARNEQQQAQFEKQFGLQQEQFEQQKKGSDLNMLMQQYELTGVMNPEMLEAFGLDMSSGDRFRTQQQMRKMGMGGGGSDVGGYWDRTGGGSLGAWNNWG